MIDMLIRIYPDKLNEFKQFLKNFGHKRSKKNTVVIFPDGETIQIYYRGAVGEKIGDWLEENALTEDAPEVDIVRLGINRDFWNKNDYFIDIEAIKPLGDKVIESIETEIIKRPYLTRVHKKIYNDFGKYKQDSAKLYEKFTQLLQKNNPISN